MHTKAATVRPGEHKDGARAPQTRVSWAARGRPAPTLPRHIQPSHARRTHARDATTGMQLEARARRTPARDPPRSVENPYRIQQIELKTRSEPQGNRLGPDGCRKATCRTREVGVGGRVRWAVLWQGWQEGTYRPKLARQLEVSSPATAWTVPTKLPPKKSEDTCESGRRRADCSPPAASVERRNAQLGQDLSSSCWDARVDVNLHERVRHGVGCKACCTGISRVREASM